MQFIPLTQGKSAKVNNEDYEWLQQWKWHAIIQRRKVGDIWYAVRSTPRINGRQKSIRMHREIAARINLTQELDIDHRNGDGLDNQRHNLRQATKSQNQQNKRKRLNCNSQYKGVKAYGPKWLASISVNKIGIKLGLYDNEIEAARAYNEAALRYFGEFAKTNPV